jgi:hypothetical protein
MSGERWGTFVRGLAAVLVLLGVASCGMKSISREDWGAITPDAKIRVTTLDGAQADLTGVVVLEDALHGRPLLEERQVRIPLDSVEFVEAEGRNLVWPILSAIAAAGVTIAIIQARGKSDEAPPPTQVGSNSCPFIYSFDGDGYRLDSETFAGAITRGVQRADLDNLEHLRAVDGSYRMRLTNERPETQYTDEVSLTVVDHPEGTRVFPDALGNPRVLRGEVGPLRAQGLHGGDALEAVSAADGLPWVGAPLEAVDLEDPASLRDGLELTFPRPAGDGALLAVRAKNTELAPHALRTFLELMGEGLVEWYRQVDHDPGLQGRLKQWVAREGTLHVSVWRDEGWQLQDMLLDVGPHLPKTQVARLDLAGLSGEEVRIRVEGAHGLWALDRLSLGVEDSQEPVTRRISASEAVGPEGRDLRAVLEGTDGTYLTTLEGHAVDLVFPAPPEPETGFRRTVLARTSGFYHIYVDQSGEPAPRIVDRILDEPLFGNRYMLGELLTSLPDR